MSHSDYSPEYWMNLALEQAKYAESIGEVPVGAIIVKDNQIIAKGFNNSINSCDPTAHAEVVALRSAGVYFNNYRLTNCDLYVTLEPCIMCLGALLHSRINKLYYGASDPKTGALGGLVDLTQLYIINHQLNITGQILASECSIILKEFFKCKR